MTHMTVCDYKFPSREECWRFWRLAVGMEVEVIEGWIPYFAGLYIQIQKVLIQYSTRYKKHYLVVLTGKDIFIARLRADFTPEISILRRDPVFSGYKSVDLEHLFERVCAAHTDFLLLLGATGHSKHPSKPLSRFVRHPLCDFGGLYRLMRDFWRVA